MDQLESDWVNATPSGVWVYRTTFDLSGMQLNTARLTGQLVSDNDGTLFLNGNNTGIVSTRADTWTTFDISNPSWFVAGINNVDFRVINDPFTSFNPSAMRADLNVVAAVPEPSTLLLLAAAALAGLVFCWRRRVLVRNLFAR